MSALLKDMHELRFYLLLFRKCGSVYQMLCRYPDLDLTIVWVSKLRNIRFRSPARWSVNFGISLDLNEKIV